MGGVGSEDLVAESCYWALGVLAQSHVSVEVTDILRGSVEADTFFGVKEVMIQSELQYVRGARAIHNVRTLLFLI